MDLDYTNENTYSAPPAGISRGKLISNCANCFGLCCVALCFSASEGFPINKDAGQPCINLQTDFRCSVHESLTEKGLKGCIAFECFGAGQKVSQVSFKGHDWGKAPESAEKMFKVFINMRQMHELLWYLTEALSLPQASPIHGELSTMLVETERLTNIKPESLLELDVAVHRAAVNTMLLEVSRLVRAEVLQGRKVHFGRQRTLGHGADLIAADLRKFDLRGAALRGAYLIAADLRGNDLSWTDFIGADFRDADLSGADLTRSIFLTQAQLDAAKGDASTKIPSFLTRPVHWSLSRNKLGE